MLTFVLVHGAFHGGWCWSRVAGHLTAAGHRVLAPTLAGLGERRSTASPAVNLTRHIDEIEALIRLQQLDNVVLCGHSYGGLVVTGVADRLPERLGALVYCDAFIPADGDSALNLIAPDQKWKDALLDRVGRNGGWLMPPAPAKFFDLRDPADIALVDTSCTPQPVATYLEKIRLTGAWRQARNLTYILAAGSRADTTRRHSAPLRDDPQWRYYEVDCGHEVMLDQPGLLATMLVEAAATR
jgi:pimeloyl-ACP methyl ester carboxylesterase